VEDKLPSPNSSARRSAQPLDAVKTPLPQSLGKGAFWVFTRIWVPMMAIGWPFLVIYGLANPRPNDLALLNLTANETPLLVGVVSGGPFAQRSYFLPRRLLKGGGISVVSDHNGRLSAEAQPATGFLLLAIWFGCIWASWRFLVRRRVTASNKSLERTRG